MPKGNRKGSSFERLICKKLSLWWTDGDRDDVFWRSSQSGGRATQRAKSGKKTYGSYGDVAAVDPIGEPLIRSFTIELKRGRSHGHPGDMIDRRPTEFIRPWEKTMKQAVNSHEQAGSWSWLLIVQRDCRVATVYFPAWVFKRLGLHKEFLPYFLFKHHLNGFKLMQKYVGMPLDTFLVFISKDHIIEIADSLPR